MKKPKPRTYAFDFDGVIAHYNGFKGAKHVGKPNAKIVDAIRLLKERGHKILIYSTRASAQLRAYCKEHGIPVDYFNKNPNLRGANPGKPIASVYVDDRAITYRGQSAKKLIEDMENSGHTGNRRSNRQNICGLT